MGVSEVESNGGAARKGVAEGGVGAPAYLLAVIAVPVELGVGERRVDVDRPVDLPRPDVVLQETERAGLTAQLDAARVVPRLADEVDRSAQRVPAIRERVGAFVDLDALGRQELEGLEVAEPIRLPVDEAIDEDVDAAQVKVVTESGAANRELALVGGAEARPDHEARDEVEHVLEVGPTRLLDRRLVDDRGAARNARELLAGFLVGARAVRRHSDAFDHDGLEPGRRLLRRGRRRLLSHGRCGEEQDEHRHDDSHMGSYRSRNSTGSSTHTPTASAPRLAGSKRHRLTALAAALSRSGWPADS